MKKIFLVSEYILPNQNTTGYLFHKLHENLKKQYGERLQLIVKEDPDHLIENAILITDVNLNKKQLVQRLIFELIVSFKFLLKLILNVKNNDVVFSGTNPSLLLPVIYFAQKIKKFKWILLIHDVFPENLIAAKILKKNNIFYRSLKYFFDKFYSSADIRIVIGKDMKALVDNKVRTNDSIIIQNWIDHHDIDVHPKIENPIIQQLGWQNDQPIFQFFGNIGRVQGIHNILEAFKLIEKNLRPKILFIGGGVYENELRAELERIKDPNIQYIGSIDQSQKSQGLNAGDIAIVTLADGMLGLGVPSKAYFSMAADKPILAIMEEDSEVARMIQKYEIGWVVAPGNPKKLAEAFIEIMQKYKSAKNTSPRNILVENYSEEIAMNKLINVIQKIF